MPVSPGNPTVLTVYEVNRSQVTRDPARLNFPVTPSIDSLPNHTAIANGPAPIRIHKPDVLKFGILEHLGCIRRGLESPGQLGVSLGNRSAQQQEWKPPDR